MFKGAVETACDQINENFTSAADVNGFIVGLEGPVMEFVEDAWRVSMVLAAVVFAIVACYELYAQSVRMEGTGSAIGSAELVFKVMFKVAVCYIVLQVSLNLLVGVFNTGNSLIAAFEGAGDVFISENGEVKADVLDAAAIAEQVPGGMKGLAPYLCTLVVLFLSWAVKIAAWALILIRVLQIYLYIAVSPIPLATLPSNELSQIGKSFLKSFVAVCLQGALIYLVVLMFPHVLQWVLETGMGGYEPVQGSILGMLFLSVVYSVAIIVTLFGTQQLAHKICGSA